jgi:hypothetical protein
MSQSHQRKRTNQSTQWTTQFLAAAELCRRGYVVTFTMGNCTQDYDLIVVSPGGKPFLVDVKGLSSNADWLIRKKSSIEGLYYILIRIDKQNKNEDRFFIMSQDDVNKELDKYYSKPKKDGTVKSNTAQGFGFKQAEEYENKWGILP